jgi:hypothetical protein
MSFFKKIKAELREMLADDDDKEKDKKTNSHAGTLSKAQSGSLV